MKETTKILVKIRDKIAMAAMNALYICGNSDFVIVFDFDEEWNAFETKTARFTYGGVYQDVIFTGNECPVPIISNIHSFRLGVFAGDLHTTTPAYVSAKKSILCDGGLPADPLPDVYTQIMGLLNRLSAEKMDKALGDAYAGQLLAVGADGSVHPLQLGDGLEIVDGVLRVTYTPAPDEPEIVAFVQQDDGSVLMEGVTFVQQDDGSILWDGATFTMQDDGSVLIN